MYRNGSYKCHFILYVPTKIPLSSAATHVKNSVIFLCIRCKKAVLFLCIRCKKCHFRMFLSAIRGKIYYVSLCYVWKMLLCFSVLRVKNTVIFLCIRCKITLCFSVRYYEWKIPLFSSLLGLTNSNFVSLYYVWKMPLFSSVLGVKIGILFICTMCEKLHYFPLYSLGMVLLCMRKAGGLVFYDLWWCLIVVSDKKKKLFEDSYPPAIS